MAKALIGYIERDYPWFELTTPIRKKPIRVCSSWIEDLFGYFSESKVTISQRPIAGSVKFQVEWRNLSRGRLNYSMNLFQSESRDEMNLFQSQPRSPMNLFQLNARVIPTARKQDKYLYKLVQYFFGKPQPEYPYVFYVRMGKGEEK